MKCEVVREGQACSNNATLIVRTPWTTQLACEGCSWSFKRYETQYIDEFTCDWPVDGKDCGERATHYYKGEGHQRPLCAGHASKVNGGVQSIDEYFNPKLVPYQPLAQPQPRVEQKADGTLVLRCHCGAPGKYRGGVETMPLCDKHAPQTTTPKAESPPQHWETERMVPLPPGFLAPSLSDAFKDLALTAIQILKGKLEKWR